MKTFKTLLTTLTALVVCSALLPNVAVADTTKYVCPSGWTPTTVFGTPTWLATNAVVANSSVNLCPMSPTSAPCATIGYTSQSKPSALYSAFFDHQASPITIGCIYGAGDEGSVRMKLAIDQKNCTVSANSKTVTCTNDSSVTNCQVSGDAVTCTSGLSAATK